MATIAGLAIKITANIGSLTSGMTGAVKSVESMMRAADAAKPSLKSLEDAADALKPSYDALRAAQEKAGTDWLGGSADDQAAAVNKVNEGIQRLSANIQRLGDGVADDILKMKPTMNNIIEAQQRLESLEQVKQRVFDSGGDGNMLNEAIERARESTGKLAENAVNAEMQMASLKSVMFSLNNTPFMVLGNLMTDVMLGMKNFGSEFNERFNGIPALVAKVIAVIVSLAVVIGLAGSKMMLLNGATVAWTSLVKSSMVYQGFAGLITLLNTILGTQIAITAATVAWAAVITLGLAVVVAAIAAGFTEIWRELDGSVRAAAELEHRIESIEKGTEQWRDKTGKMVEQYKELNRLAVQYHEANLSGSQKYFAELQKIDDVLTKQSRADGLEKSFQAKHAAMLAQYQAATKKEEKEAIAKQMEDVVKDWEAFRREVADAPVLTAADAAAAKTAALDSYRESLGIAKSDAVLLKEQTGKLLDGLNAGVLTYKEFDTLLRTAREQYDPVIKARIQAEKEGLAAAEQQNAAMRQIQEEQEKARMQLISGYLTDAAPASLGTVMRELEQHAKQAGLSMQELTAAQNRAKESFEKQSSLYNDYQNTLEEMKSPIQRLQEYGTKLRTEMVKFGWDPKVINVMLEKYAEKLFPSAGVGVRDMEPAAAARSSSGSNPAAVVGTMAYYEAQNRSNQPLLTESRRQTSFLQIISDNTRMINHSGGTGYNVNVI